jgi:hypothetical protein
MRAQTPNDLTLENLSYPTLVHSRKLKASIDAWKEYRSKYHYGHNL